MPREPDDGAVMMQGALRSNVAGICTIMPTFLRPVPSSAKAMNSLPAILPSPAVTAPADVTFGPYRVP